ncbi:MAG: hypothetical protein LBQ20_11810 [Rhodanobacter sp.]|nr:hypothetical protein [Rhodanobacter sp.]
MDASKVNTTQFLTVRQTAQKYPAFTEPSIRWLIFNRLSNGFSRCIVQIGRRTLIDESEFVAWLRDHRGNKSCIAAAKAAKEAA